jgi:hypothetical protein
LLGIARPKIGGEGQLGEALQVATCSARSSGSIRTVAGIRQGISRKSSICSPPLASIEGYGYGSYYGYSSPSYSSYYAPQPYSSYYGPVSSYAPTSYYPPYSYYRPPYAGFYGGWR